MLYYYSKRGFIMAKKTDVEKNEKPVETVEETKPVESNEETVAPVEDKEVPVTEEKKEVSEPDPIIKLEKLGPEESNIGELIENERKGINDLYKKEKKISTIAMVVAVGLIVLAIVLLSLNIPNGIIISFVIAGVVLVGLIVYYALSKNKFPSATKEYIMKVCTLFNRSSYAIPELKNPTYNPKEKVELNDLIAEKVYSTVSEISSRNVVHATYLKSPITFSDVALYVPGEKKGMKKVVFLGKHITFDNDFHFEGRYIIQLRTAEKDPTDTPTDIGDLVVRYGGADYTVYGVEKADFKKDIGLKFIDSIRNVKVDGSLLNVNVVLWAGHTGIYLSYDDALMSIPFEHPYRNDCHTLYNNQLKLILKALKDIKK